MTSLPSHEFARSDRDITAIPGGACEDNELLSNVFDELLNSALLTATTASIVTWYAVGHADRSHLNLSVYMPAAPLLFPVIAARLLTSRCHAAMAGAVREYYDRLDFLRSMSLEFARAPDRQNANPGIEFGVLVASWQALCGVAASALEPLSEALDEATRDRGRPRYNRIVQTLRAARNKEHPCIARDGTMTVPFWAERRLGSRSTMLVHVQLMVDDQLQRVTVINATPYGLGVVGLQGVEQGSEVCLVIKSGETLPARVAWRQDDRAGIKLDEPLPKHISDMLALTYKS